MPRPNHTSTDAASALLARFAVLGDERGVAQGAAERVSGSTSCVGRGVCSPTTVALRLAPIQQSAIGFVARDTRKAEFLNTRLSDCVLNIPALFLCCVLINQLRVWARFNSRGESTQRTAQGSVCRAIQPFPAARNETFLPIFVNSILSAWQAVPPQDGSREFRYVLSISEVRNTQDCDDGRPCSCTTSDR